jgi:hypothetical protein
MVASTPAIRGDVPQSWAVVTTTALVIGALVSGAIAWARGIAYCRAANANARVSVMWFSIFAWAHKRGAGNVAADGADYAAISEEITCSAAIRTPPSSIPREARPAHPDNEA